MLELKHIHKYYNPGTVNEMCLFSDFNLTVNDGDFISIIGSNGSGKTSLLNIICGSIPIESGSIVIHGKEITKAKDFRRYARIGRVFQNPATGTCPSMTILENMSLADNKGSSFNLRPGTNKKRIDHYRELLSQLGLGLENKLDTKVGALSGGQLQRVLLALALEPVPHILILDEPLSGVDIEGEHQLLEMLDELRTEYDLSIFLSTHDFATLGQFADKVILLNRQVLKVGTPDEVLSSPEFYDTFHLRVGKGGEG